MPRSRVRSVVGAEQEYFIINKELYGKRSDLVYTGRTLFGAAPPKGQELDAHYFRPPTDDVIRFMQDVDDELWKLGIIVKTEHNEVAPCQCELAPCYSDSTDACNQNQLIMETLKTTAEKHGFKCLLHEKPFDKINGSGKHNNWSLITDRDENLFETGNTAQENARYLLFLAGVVKAVDEYNDLLLASVASASNDLRLGGYEAPPQILTVFLGEPLDKTIQYACGGKWRAGKDCLPKIVNVTDRNRTSPFAFTGNKFEFRMVGSSASISDVNTTLNVIVAESLRQFADELDNACDVWQKTGELITQVFAEHKRVIFDGNNYSDDWIEEAKKRGLLQADAVESIAFLSREKNLQLFERHGVLTRREQLARQDILLQTYCNAVQTEGAVTAEMFNKQIAPCVEKYQTELALLIDRKNKLSEKTATEADKLNRIVKLTDDCAKASAYLQEKLRQIPTENSVEKARYCQTVIRPSYNEVRLCADELERLCPANEWALPNYGQLLFEEN